MKIIPPTPEELKSILCTKIECTGFQQWFTAMEVTNIHYRISDKTCWKVVTHTKYGKDNVPDTVTIEQIVQVMPKTTVKVTTEWVPIDSDQ